MSASTPVRVLFRCEHCDERPDRDTQRTLEGQLRDRSFGEYLDAQPGGWLIFTAGGPLGPRRYACASHRDELICHLRTHYAAVHAGVRRTEPYRTLWPDGFSALDEHELTRLLADAPTHDALRASPHLDRERPPCDMTRRQPRHPPRYPIR